MGYDFSVFLGSMLLENRIFREYTSLWMGGDMNYIRRLHYLEKFARFMDVCASSHGELLNYTNIARDCAIDAKTVKAYYQILVDTLIGYFVYPFYKKSKRNHLSETPKFYLFDVGVAQYLQKIQIHQLSGIEAGNAFEHFIFTELMAYSYYSEKYLDIRFWRTSTGLEVDFILGAGKVAIECKIDSRVHASDVKGLYAFCEDYHPEKAIVVSQDVSARRLVTGHHTPIDIIPWQDFLTRLWAGEII
jgi:predicted AAA+ superfamily ATPase